MYKCLHSLICGSVGFHFSLLQCKFLYLVDYFIADIGANLSEAFTLCVLIAVIVSENRTKLLFFFELLCICLYISFRGCKIINAAYKLKSSYDILSIAVLICLSYAVSHRIVKVGDRLSAVLIVLV